MKTFATMIAATLSLVLQGAFVAAHATNASGHCTAMNVTDYISSDVHDTTTSTNWLNITDGHLNFTTSGTGCVIITFFGNAFVFAATDSYEDMHVRTLLDGNQLCVPALTNDIFLAAEFPAPQTASSVAHICKNVAPGPHTVQVQYRSQGGAEVDIYGHTLTITHN